MFDIPQEKMFLIHQELQLLDSISKTLSLDPLESMFVLQYIAEGSNLIEAFQKVVIDIEETNGTSEQV
jgi:hypothetical protein